MLEEWLEESEKNEYFLSAIFCVFVCVCIIEWKQFYIDMLSNISPLCVSHKKTYRKISKIWDTSNNCHNCPKIRKV